MARFLFVLATVLAGCDGGKKEIERKQAAIEAEQKRAQELAEQQKERAEAEQKKAQLAAEQAEKIKQERLKEEEDRKQKESEKFNFEVEASKALAVKEFPKLQEAGSAMNKAFVEEVNFLRQWKSPDLQNPNWPYLVSLRVADKLKAVEMPQSVQPAQPAQPVQPAQPRPLQQNGVLTIPELRQINPLPKQATIKGRITSIEPDGMVVADKLDAYVTIDSVLGCFVKLPIVQKVMIPGSYPQSFRFDYLYDQRGFILALNGGRLEIQKVAPTGDGIGRSRVSKTITNQFFNAYSKGMDVIVRGELSTKPNGKVILRGELEGLGSNPPK